MSKSVEFIVILDDGARKRHRHETIGGKVINFVVQLEIKVKQEWKVAIRYDCNIEAGQPVAVVHLKKWRLHSVIEDMTLTRVTA
jgi:hypothetical protein